jgi:hypothetical protein
MNNTQHIFFISLKKKKPDLKNLRQEKLRGCYIRSKMQWAEEGEKPCLSVSSRLTALRENRSSKYFGS